MKMLLGITLVLASFSSVKAQAPIIFANTSSSLIETNALAIGGTAGPTSGDPGGFYYALFSGPLGVTSVTASDLLSPPWIFSGLYATNRTGGAGRFITDGLAQSYTTAGFQLRHTNSFVIAGWSSNVAGENWLAAVSQFANAEFALGGYHGGSLSAVDAGKYFGLSSVGQWINGDTIFGSSGPLFGSGYGQIGGFSLYTVVPEPSVVTFGLLVSVVMFTSRKK